MIFVDTGAFLARYIERDQHHREADAIWETLNRSGAELATSNFIIDETLTLLARRAGYAFAAERARGIYASYALRILRPDQEDEMKALAWFEKLADQQVSFTDCVSFALMKRHRLIEAFTFDSHFKFAGFRPVK